MTPKNVIAEFRRYIRDTEKTRYTRDEDLQSLFKLAFEALWKRHRHLFYVARIVNQIPAVTGLGDELELQPEALSKLAHYMAYEALQEDAEDAHNLTLAKVHLEQFATP